MARANVIALQNRVSQIRLRILRFGYAGLPQYVSMRASAKDELCACASSSPLATSEKSKVRLGLAFERGTHPAHRGVARQDFI